MVFLVFLAFLALSPSMLTTSSSTSSVSYNTWIQPAWAEEFDQKASWVCLKIGYIPNYSHLIGIMIINNHWV